MKLRLCITVLLLKKQTQFLFTKILSMNIQKNYWEQFLTECQNVLVTKSMVKFFFCILCVSVLASCAPKRTPNACERALNVQEVFKTLHNLPENYQIREVTQNYISKSANSPTSYLPQRIYY